MDALQKSADTFETPSSAVTVQIFKYSGTIHDVEIMNRWKIKVIIDSENIHIPDFALSWPDIRTIHTIFAEFHKMYYVTDP